MKKLLIFTLSLMILFFPVVSADIISINSGGSIDFVINPYRYLEGFFLNANRFPVASGLTLFSSSGTDTTNENLSISYTASDLDSDAITNITDWRLDGSSIAFINMPFDKRVHSGDATRDYSTFQNNGTINDNTEWIKWGQVGGAYLFSGGDDIQITSSISTNGTDGITVEAWIYRYQSPTSYHTIFSLGDQDHYDGYHWLYIRNTTDGRVSWQATNGTARYTESINTNILFETWAHLAVTHNYTAQEVRYYVNGSYIGNDATEGVEAITSETARIGTYYSGDSHVFNGSIDELRVYNRTLTYEQIKNSYDAGLAGRHIEDLFFEETNKGDSWRVALTPNDLFDDGITVLSNVLTISNAEPNDPQNVALLSLNARNESDTDLNCSGYVSDDDNFIFTVQINWSKDGEENFTQQFTNQNNGTTFSTLLDNGNLTLGDVWKCSIRIYDGSDYSSWVDSNNLTIIDITNPNVTIINPNWSENYTTADVNFNVSIEENENISWCGYSVNQTANVTMTEVNNSYFWYLPDNLIPGTHNVTFSCNDTSGNWGVNSTNFTILDEAAISIYLSPSLAANVNWTLTYLPVDDLNATGNNGSDITEYWVNISSTSVTVDLYVKADDNLTTDALDVLVLGNETFVVNTTNNTVPDLNRITMDTSYILIGENLENATTVYMKFYLDAPSGQPGGTYTNNLDFKAVRNGVSP